MLVLMSRSRSADVESDGDGVCIESSLRKILFDERERHCQVARGGEEMRVG